MSALPRTRAELARLIDHTLLRPEATCEQIDQLCDQCLAYGFFAACVQPFWVERCVRRLAGQNCGTGILPVICTVAGFPHGASLTETKAFEARRAVEQGALEVDMVANLGELIAGNREAVTRDIAAVVEAAKGTKPAALVKVILETRALTDEQIRRGCRCAIDAGADFVKTSTGFHPADGATIEHVSLLRRCTATPSPFQGEGWGEGRRLRVKAAGGIRDLPTALAMLEAGADRLGLSASVSIVEALPTQHS